MEKKQILAKCWLRALAMFSALSFLWVAFIAMGTNDNSGTVISEFADRLVKSDLCIAFYSLVYGFSLLIIQGTKMSTPAKYSLHILVNYVAAMVCVYALFANVSDVGTKGWMAVILLATVVFFLIYGIASLVIRLVKKHFN